MRGRGGGPSRAPSARASFATCHGDRPDGALVTEAGKVVIANAPVSYGAFELTVGILPGVPDGDTVLDEVAGAGYAGIDLGPMGYLGYGEDLAAALRRRGLALSGGFSELPFSETDKMPAALRELGSLLDVFADAG